MRSEADSRQVAGDHYINGIPEHLEHWNVVAALGWDYYIGAATKYLWRLGKKDDPVKELRKAIHYLEKKIELLESETGAAPAAVDWGAVVNPDGWVGFTFEGGNTCGNHYRCKTCLLRFTAPRGALPGDHHACGAEPTQGYTSQ